MMRIPLPDDVVLGIYFAQGQRKTIAAEYDVGTATVTQIKKGSRRGKLIQAELARRVRAEAAMLVTCAAFPSARPLVAIHDPTCSHDTLHGRLPAN